MGIVGSLPDCLLVSSYSALQVAVTSFYF